MERRWLSGGCLPGRGFVFAALVLFCIVLWLLPRSGNVLLWAAAFLIVAGAVRPAVRRPMWRIAMAALCAACLALMLHLLADHFHLRYVWLYSGAALPIYLKLSNLWGGDEGTVLLLATFCMGIAVRNMPLQGWAGRGAGLIAAWYAGTAAWLGPFSATPPEWLASQASQGMNAHLQTLWMAFHAPLILAAYAWMLAPAGAALEALNKSNPAYGQIALGYGRWAWPVLTTGIGFGMVWALEDFTFGQIWHWDSVQTAVFAIWALCGAVLHGARRWHPAGANRRLLPILSLLAAMLTCVAMSVTRSQVVVSSHRYAGTTSWMSHLMLATALLGLTAWHARKIFFASLETIRRKSRGASDWMLDAAIYLFSGAAFLAAGALFKAYLYEWLKVEKSSDMMPFLETLMPWVDPEELTRLRRTFEQWDVEGYTLAAWLAPILALLGLMGGYVFLRRVFGKTISLAVTFAAGAFQIAIAWRGGWLTNAYTGEGVLSQHIVDVLPWLDAALIGGAFLLGTCLLWSLASLRRAWRKNRRLAVLRHTGSLALIHGGAALALTGGLLATVMNVYFSITIPPNEALNDWHGIAGEMKVRVLPYASTRAEDDRRGGVAGYRAVAQVELQVGDQTVAGHALFQDSRKLPPGYQGPVRQLCEILDYRYARYAGDRGYMLHPFIVRGWSRDLQVWLPASARLLSPSRTDSASDDTQSVVVIRRYPFVSLIWIGLAAMVAGSLLLGLGGGARVKALTSSVSKLDSHRKIKRQDNSGNSQNPLERRLESLP